MGSLINVAFLVGFLANFASCDYGYHKPKCHTEYKTVYETIYETSYKKVSFIVFCDLRLRRIAHRQEFSCRF